MNGEYFRVGNMVSIMAGQWKGDSGVIVSIFPDRQGRDDLIQVRRNSGEPASVPTRSSELKTISSSRFTARP